MHYSIAHDWQAAPNVKQVLVFVDALDKENFERDHLIKDDVFPYTDSQFDDKNVSGVFVKLRAVLNGDEKWIPIIRTVDGTLIKEYSQCFSSWQLAIGYAKVHMKKVAG